MLQRRLLIIALSLMSAACATTSGGGAAVAKSAPVSNTPEDAAAPAAATSLTPEQQTQWQMHVLTGEIAAGRKLPETAAREFLAALQLVGDAELAQRATSLALESRNEALAMTAAQRWQQLAPNESDPREVIARLALTKGDQATAYAQCEAIISGSAGGPEDGFRQVSQILALAGKPQSEAALKLMQQLVAQWPQLPEAHHALGLLALRYGNLPLADEAAAAALRLAPGSREQLLLTTGVRVRQERFDEADAIIQKLAKADKNPTELRMGYAKLLLETHQRERARSQLRKVLEENPKSVDARYALAVMAVRDKNHAEAERELKPLLDGERGSEAALQLGQIEEARKNYAQALSYYERVVEGPPMMEAAVRRAHVMALLGRKQDARDLMQGLREEMPQFSERLFLAEAEIFSEVGDSEQALSVYQQAFKQSPDNAELLYGRSLIYEQQKKLDLAEQDLRAILKQDGDNARALNALGYMLTVHTQRYKEAKKLIARAYELEPDDAAIMDSMGWIQYRMGDTSGARELLQKAFDKFPDPEVAAHLGEVLWQLGDKTQARALWQKALADDPDHAALKETVQRLDP